MDDVSEIRLLVTVKYGSIIGQQMFFGQSYLSIIKELNEDFDLVSDILALDEGNVFEIVRDGFCFEVPNFQDFLDHTKCVDYSKKKRESDYKIKEMENYVFGFDFFRVLREEMEEIIYKFSEEGKI